MSAPTWLLDRIRQEHVPPATPAENLCIGTPEHCQVVAGPQAEQHPWGEEFAAARPAFDAIFMLPEPGGSLPEQLPTSLNDTRASRLTLPYPYLPQAPHLSWLDQVTALAVNGPRIDSADLDAFWKWPGIDLPRLRTLRILQGAQPFWPKLELSGEHFPGLEAFESPLAGKNGLARLRTFNRLRFAEIHDVKNLDVLAALPATLEALIINTGGKNLPLAALEKLTTLRALGLYNVRAEIDCAMFRELPALTELRLQGCPSVTRIEALLQVPQLISVEVFDSGAPVQGAITGEFQHRFSPLALDYQ